MKKLLILLLFVITYIHAYSQSPYEINFIDSFINNQKKWEQQMCNNKTPIEIIYLRSSYPNSAGGTGIDVEIRNLSTKTIKYIYFSGYPINAVNDRCFCSIRGCSDITLKGTGPIKYGDYQKYGWDNVWYDGDIEKYIPTSITIQYMDGSRVKITKQNINKILSYTPSDLTIINSMDEYKIDASDIRRDLYKNNIRKDLYKILIRCAVNESTLKREYRMREIEKQNEQ